MYDSVFEKGVRLPFYSSPALLLQVSLWELVSRAKPLPIAVMILLLIFSVLSWAIVFSKWNVFRGNRI